MKQLDPKAVWLFFFSYILRFAILVWFLGIFFGPIFFGGFFMLNQSSENSTPIDVSFSVFGIFIFLYIFMVIIISYIWAKLSYKFYKYELTDIGFRKESGVIYKKYITIPYDRIQNVDINRGILARILGLSDLQIQTAGASAVISRYGMSGVGAEGRLPGLQKEVAEQLRDELIQRAHNSKNQGL